MTPIRERLRKLSHVAIGRIAGTSGARYLGVVAVLAIAVLLNLFGRRFDKHWDLTTDHRYTPTAPLRKTLESLKQDVTITVLLARSDPLAPTLEQLLGGYRLLTQHLSIDWVDPDREPVRFLTRQSELGLGAGRTEDGQVTSDSILVVSAGGRRHYVEAEGLLGLDPEFRDSTTQAEQAITVAIRSLFEHSPPVICFTEGHRELSVLDQSPLGLSRLKTRIERDAGATKSVDLTNAKDDTLDACRVIVVAAPDVAMSPNAIRRLTQATSKSSLLLLGGAVPDQAGHLLPVGLEGLAALGGIALGSGVVVEMDDAFRLPNAFGETFLSTPVEHQVTRGLLRGRVAAPLRVVVSLAPSLQAMTGSEALPLLVSSQTALVLSDVTEQSIARLETTRGEAKQRIVAMIGPVKGAASVRSHIAIAPANVLQNRTFETADLVVTQAFGLSLISFLAGSPNAEVEFDPRPSRGQGFELSDQELTSITRYTVLVMPGCFLLVGLSVLWMRRKRPDRDSRGRSETPE